MIDAAGIPVIDGNMDALIGHATTIAATGRAIADTGTDVHTTWQGLAPHYIAPEAVELLAATGPIPAATATVSADLTSASNALISYADEVRAIQTRLDTLRAQATELTTTADPADPATTERSDELLRMVNLAVADFEEAQRRCANALRELTGGTPLQADNGDGVIAPGEFGLTAAQYDAAAAGPGVPWGRPAPAPEAGGGGPSWSDIGHTALDIGGLIPFAGEVFDGANAIWYAAEGDYLNAGLSTAAMVPMVGWTATGAKYGVRMAHSVDGVAAWAKNRPSMVPWFAKREPFTPNAKFPQGSVYTWVAPGTNKRVQYHAHGPDPDRLPTENAGQGPIYRIREGNNWLDAAGNRYTRNQVKPSSPVYSPQAANDTHIPFPKDQPRPDEQADRFTIINPVAVGDPVPEDD